MLFSARIAFRATDLTMKHGQKMLKSSPSAGTIENIYLRFANMPQSKASPGESQPYHQQNDSERKVMK